MLEEKNMEPSSQDPMPEAIASLDEFEDPEVVRIIKKTAKRAKSIYRTNSLTALSACALFVVMLCTAGSLMDLAERLWLFGSLSVFGSLLARSIYLMWQLYVEGSDEVSKIDKRGINALAQLCIHSKGTRLAPMATRRFTEVLCEMNASDALRINAATRIFIGQLLLQANTDHLLDLLRGLEQVGDYWCLSSVKLLGKSYARLLHHKRYEEVRAQAQRTAEFIQQRLDEGKTATTLLRPSSPSENPKALLRPVTQTPDDAPQVLLRANDSQE